MTDQLVASMVGALGALPLPGTLLIALGAFSSIVATTLLAAGYLESKDIYPRVTLGSTVLAVGSLVLAHLLLTYQFIVGDYTNAYVWENSAEYLSIFYRITAVYASHEGSILFWATLTAIVAAWTVISPGFTARGSRLVQAIALAIVAAFATMLVTQSPFTPVHIAYPEVFDPGVVPTDGDGLNPLLIDPWMAIHPPITFAAYALIVVPFALGITHFVSAFRGDSDLFDRWYDSAMLWMRGSWLMLTAAIAMGGIWAYEVLGWGGFWTWDPVETASLIPWLFLTASLHAMNQYDRSGEYPIFAPASLSVLFPLVIYATAVVRSDVFRSVHSFSAGGIGVGIMVMLFVTGILAIGLPFAYWFREAEDDADSDLSLSIEEFLSRRTIFHSVILIFGMLAFVSFWGLSFPVLRAGATGVEVSVGATYYNLWSYPLVVIGLLAGGLFACYSMGKEIWGRRLTLGVAIITALAVLYTPSASWMIAEPAPHDPAFYQYMGSVSVLSIVPPALFFAGSWTVRWYRRIQRTSRRSVIFRETGILSVHVGAAIMIVAVSFVYLFATSGSVMVMGIDDIDSDEDDVVIRDVPETEYTLAVTDYGVTETPSIQEAADTPAEVLGTDPGGQDQDDMESAMTAVLLRGEITDIDTTEGFTVAEIDDSGLWVGYQADEIDYEIGSEILVRGSNMGQISEDIELLLFTNAENAGTIDAPPEGVYTPRVESHQIGVQLYDQDETLVASGTIAEQEYTRSEMNTNDVVLDRGVTHDTMITGTMAEVEDVDGLAAPAAVSVTVYTYPLANQIWVGIILMLLGMGAVLAVDRPTIWRD